MPRRSLTALDLFAGAGGMSLGLERAGFRVLAAVERDHDAASTFQLNHPDVKMYKSDIRTVAVSQLRAELKVERGELDLLVGCPPCQGFTRLTEKSGDDDPRNMLIRDYIRFVRGLLPRACIFENVPGLRTRGSHLFAELTDALSQLGYRFQHEVVQMADYGVPQMRRRLVLMASRTGCVEFPKATHGRPKDEGRVIPWRTVREALRDVPRPPSRELVKSGEVKLSKRWHYSRVHAPIVLKRLQHAVQSKGRDELPPELRLRCHSDLNGYHDVYGAMKWDEPSPAITSGCTNSSKGRFTHPEEARPLTAFEASLLQTFPKSYEFTGSGVESVARQIGNAVPVRFATLMARAVAKSLRRHSA